MLHGDALPTQELQTSLMKVSTVYLDWLLPHVASKDTKLTD